MGKLNDGDDGLPVEEVGIWAKEKHTYLNRYLDISRAVRARWLGPGRAGATFIDPFCGPGRCRIRETGEFVDGGVVAAWKMSVSSGAPFSQVYVGDLDPKRREAATHRLKALGAPVVALEGNALQMVLSVVPLLNPHGLHFAFLDPFNLEALDFAIIKNLAELKRIDMLVHINQMDLQRNLINNVDSEESAFDALAPGWRDKVDSGRKQSEVRQAVFLYWRDLVASQGVWPSLEMRLISGHTNQPLYWLLIAAKHDLAHQFWATASNVEGQGSLGF